MVGFNLDESQARTQRKTALAHLVLVRELGDFPHEGAGVETQGIISLLELVQFLHHGHRDHDVVVLELLHALVVVKDDIGV